MPDKQLHIAFDPIYAHPLPEGHRFPMLKYELIPEQLLYEGVIGPVSFDEYGDITGPFRLWKITDGKVTTVGEMPSEDVSKIKASLTK